MARIDTMLEVAKVWDHRARSWGNLRRRPEMRGCTFSYPFMPIVTYTLNLLSLPANLQTTYPQVIHRLFQSYSQLIHKPGSLSPIT
jgi:hypothetical protein